MKKRIPTTFCQYMDTPDRRVVDLSPDGVPEIPVLGCNKATKVRAGKGRLRCGDFVRGKHEPGIWLHRKGQPPVPGALTFE